MSYLALVKIDHPCSWSIIIVDSNPGKVIYEFLPSSSKIVKQMLMWEIGVETPLSIRPASKLTIIQFSRK